MPETVNVRSAQPGDIPACCALLHMLFALEADCHFELRAAEAALRQLTEPCPDHIVYCADGDDGVIGMCSAQLLISTVTGTPVAVLEDLIVSSQHRGRGIGRALLTAIERWAMAHGCARIQLLADADNAPALAFYKHEGWQMGNMRSLRKSLPAEPQVTN